MNYQFSNSNLIIFVIIIAQGYLGEAAPSNTHTDYDILMLSQAWLPAYCQSKEKLHLKHFCSKVSQYQKWSINELLAVDRQGNSLGNCASSQSLKERLNMEEIKSYIKELQKNWIDVYAVNNNNANNIGQILWEKEWKKHGTCVVDLTQAKPQENYFKKALDFYENFNIEAIMNQIKINSKSRYESKWILDRIDQELHRESQFLCVTNEAGQQFLAEVRTCFDKQNNLRKCPASQSARIACVLDKPISFPGGLVGQANKSTAMNPTNSVKSPTQSAFSQSQRRH